MCAPIIFLSSCSSGGDGPSNEKLLIGKWLMTSVECDADVGIVDANGDQTILGDTSISLTSSSDIYEVIGSLDGMELKEDNTYGLYFLLEGDDEVYDNGTGDWSATSTRISVDGEDYGTYSVSANKLTINLANPNLLLEDTEMPEPMYMSLTSATVEFANVDAFIGE